MSLMLGLAIGVAAPGPKELPKKDPPLILGEWQLESAVMSGKPEKVTDKTIFTFSKEGQCVIKEGKDDEPDTMGFTLDAKKAPAEIDLIELGGMNAMPMQGICKIEGETLIICLAFDGELPKEFVSLARSQCKLMTLKRVKKN